MVASAKEDFRDVLAYAENPEEMRATWANRSDLTAAQRDALSELRRRDRQQYEKWLEAPPRRS